MALQTSAPTTTDAVRSTDTDTDTGTGTGTGTGTDVVRRTGPATAALFIVGGLCMAVGGAMHPQGSGSTVEAHLLSMFASPGWPLAHWILLMGGVAGFLALTSAWHARAFGPPGAAVAAAGHGRLGVRGPRAGPAPAGRRRGARVAHHEATPVLDVHVVMQVIASPAVGLTGALLAVLVARATGSRLAWALAVFAVVGGVASAGAGPLTVLADDPRFTVLFPFQAGLAVWLVGTGVRLLRR